MSRDPWKGKNHDDENALYEYWIGKDINYEQIWRAYEEGKGYIDKYRSMRVHLIRIKLSYPASNLPLFNYEAILKTIKGYFHDLKHLCLSRDEYMSAGPLFLYSVERSSGLWSFLGELRQLVLFGTTLADEKLVGQRLSNIDKKIEILKKHFGDAVFTEDFQNFMQGSTPRQLEKAVQKLIKQGIEKIEISKEPFIGEIESTKSTLIDVKRELKETNNST